MTLDALHRLPRGVLVRVFYSLDAEGVPVRDGRICTYESMRWVRTASHGRSRWAADLAAQDGSDVLALPEDLEVVA